MQGRLEQNRSTGRKKQQSPEEYKSMEIAKKPKRSTCLGFILQSPKRAQEKVKTLLTNP